MAADFSWHVRDLLDSVFRHKKKGIALGMLIFAAGTGVIWQFPRTYQSEAKIFLQRGRETVGIDPTATTGQTISLMQSSREDEIQSAIDVISSRGLLSVAVDRLSPSDVLFGPPGGDPKPPGLVARLFDSTFGAGLNLVHSLDPVPAREQAVRKLEQSFSIGAERNSTVLVLSYQADDPEIAQHILEAIIEVYREEHVRIYRNDKSWTFFEEQQELLKERLTRATDSLREARDRMGLASLDARAGSLENHLSTLDQGVFSSRQEAAAARAQIAGLEQALNELPDRHVTARRSVPNQGADLLRNQLYEVEVRRSELKAKYDDSHPLVQAINEQATQAAQIVQTLAETREEVTEDLNPIREQLSLELARQRIALSSADARLAVLEEERSQIATEILALNASDAEMRQLERDLKLASDSFFQYAQNFEQTRIERELAAAKISNLSMVQEPTLNYKPIKPSKMLVGLATLMLSMTAPLALALLWDLVDGRLRNPEQLEAAFGVPNLAVLERQTGSARLAADNPSLRVS